VEVAADLTLQAVAVREVCFITEPKHLKLPMVLLFQ
jgi:hypothetical protein